MEWKEEKAELLAALEREKEFRTFILNETPYLIISVGQGGAIRLANPVLLGVIGKSMPSIQGTPWKNILHEDDRDDIKYVVGNDGSVSFQARLLCVNGNEPRLIEWNVLSHHLALSDPEKTAFILSGRDITSQIEHEKQEARRQKMEALGHLAGGVAHEMNNLLQPILMFAHMMMPEAEKEKNEKNVKYLNRIINNADAASKIVRDILLYSRNEDRERDDVVLIEMIQTAASFVEDMLPVSVELECSYPNNAEIYIAHINPTDMVQVITNMLINAAHAVRDKGQIIIDVVPIKLPPKQALKLNLNAGLYMQINISDNGCGIAKDIQRRIFDPFFTTKEPEEGTGLGLSIVYKIITDWDGMVTVESEVGQGTTFSIYIPVKKTEE
jgi:PAS domain S-box-containing protein